MKFLSVLVVAALCTNAVMFYNNVVHMYKLDKQRERHQVEYSLPTGKEGLSHCYPVDSDVIIGLLPGRYPGDSYNIKRMEGTKGCFVVTEALNVKNDVVSLEWTGQAWVTVARTNVK